MCVLLLTVGALAFRVPKLDVRPMHGDEANQAFKAGLLIEKGQYHYDPVEHHGPTLYYLTLPVAWLTSAKTFADTTEWTYRSVPVVFGACTILLLLLMRDGLGFGAILFAGLFMAISPALIFYSRYYIQETLLVFFSFAAIAFGWRYCRARSLWWAVATGAMLGFMHATKETSALSYAAMAGALALTFAWSRIRDGRQRSTDAQGKGTACAGVPDNGDRDTRAGSDVERPSMQPHHLALHLLLLFLAAVLVSITLYSSFFTNIEGPLDSFRTYTTYVARAQNEHGNGIHDKPWDYFLQLLAYFRVPSITPWQDRLAAFESAPSIKSLAKGLSAGMVMVFVFAIVGGIAALARKDNGAPGVRLARFLVFYAVLLTVLYSAIPYKTPWCVINFLQPMMILAGVGAASLIVWARYWPLRIVMGLLIMAGAAHLGVTAYKANYVSFAQHRVNPYVYAHTSAVIRRLPQRAEDLAKVSPDGHHMLITVMVANGDYWPLPWYLRSFDRVGYWSRVPDNADAPMIIASPDFEPMLAAKLRDTYIEEFYELRPGVLLEVFVEKGLWDRFLATRP